jgi:NAD(P)-dependent dehydrogenase (short-subunit alcohol dehydrogenase family)
MTALANKHALVTGGGSGIGAAVAVAVAQAGATVTICGRRREALEAIASQQAGIFAEPADVTDRDAMLDLYKRAEKMRGPFAIVIANAGGAQSAPAERVTPLLWNDTLAVNLTGAF